MIMFLSQRLENLQNLFFEADGNEGGGQGGNEKHDAHLKQAITERDEAKAKAREFEKSLNDLKGKLQEIEDKKKIETGEFQKLADEYKKKFEEVNPELERLKQVEQKYTEVITARKKSLLESIPEDKREEWKESDLATLEKVVPLFSGNLNLGTDDGKTGKKTGKIETAGKSYKDFSVSELDEIKKQDPKEWDRLFREGDNKIAI